MELKLEEENIMEEKLWSESVNIALYSIKVHRNSTGQHQYDRVSADRLEY